MGEEGRPAAGFPFKGFNVEIPVKFDAGAMQQNLAKAGGVVKENAGKMGEAIGNAAGQAAESAQKTRDEITDKITELDRMLEQEITNYNDAYTLMNDRGIQLFVERSRSVDTIENVKALVNSIANRPKTFDDTFAEIETNRQKFTDACEFADRELDAARKAAGGAGAAATNAALAWLGGGALAAGGGGISAGGAFLAMAGPIGWTVAGATLLTTIVVFAKKRVKLNAEKSEEIEKVKRNTEAVRETDAKIAGLLGSTRQARDGLNGMFRDDISLYGKDYSGLSDMEKKALGNLVNNTLALSAMMDKTIE